MNNTKSALAQQATCPECGRVCRRDMNDIIKEWKAAKPKPGKRIEVWIHYWQCPGCGHKFRTATRIWPKEAKTAMGKVKLDKIRKKLLQRQTQGNGR